VSSIIVNRVADLRIGDRIKGWGGHTYDPPRVVTTTLGPIAPGSPVEGVRLENPKPGSTLELVRYPAEMDGRAMEVDRPEQY